MFGLCAGMFGNTFRNFVSQMLKDWRIQELWQQRAMEALEFQYTYWPDPENQTARAQEFINVSGWMGICQGHSCLNAKMNLPTN